MHATALEPANAPEHVAAERSLTAAKQHGEVVIADVDRGYLSRPALEELHHTWTTTNSRAWQPTNRGLFTKEHLEIDVDNKTVRCLRGVMATIPPHDRRGSRPTTAARIR